MHSIKSQASQHKNRFSKFREKFRRGWVERFAFSLLSDNFGGLRDSVPLDQSGTAFNDDGESTVVALQNDASEVSFGYSDRWEFHMSRKQFHKVMRWYFIQWSWGEWFGLRRWLWFWLLHRHVNARRRYGRTCE